MQRTIILLLVLCSCSATHDLRKAKKLIARAIEKGAVVENDTVFVTKEIIVPGESEVVEFPVAVLRDTIIFKDRVRLHIQRDTIRERIQVDCPSDTVRIEVPVTVHQSIICPPDRWKWVAIALAVILVLSLVLRRALR